MQYNFDTIVDRRGSCCIKNDDCISAFGTDDLLPMWIADMDFPAPGFITEAIERRAAHPVYGYGIRDGHYYDAIIDWVGRRNGWKIEREWIDFAPGVVAGFVFAFRALSGEGDGIAILPPTYPPFAAQIAANDRRVVNSPMKFNGESYEIDFEDLDRRLDDAAVLLFCNPHNPTGRVFTREELDRVGQLCCEHDVMIVSDEIHSDLVQKPYHHIHIASLRPEYAERTVTLIAPTKTFNIAGLSTSVAIAPGEETRRRLRRELDRYHVDQGNVFGTAALVAAYNEGEQWLDELLEYVGGNMELVCSFFRDNMPEVKCRPSQGTYLMWLDFRGLGMTHERLREFLVCRARVGLNDGELFGKEGRGFMRINLATSRAMVREALDRILHAWREYRDEK